MAIKAPPMLCIIIFLLFSTSLVFPTAEGIRILEESKANGISYGNLNPNNPNRPVVTVPPGQPYTHPAPGCTTYHCTHPEANP